MSFKIITKQLAKKLPIDHELNKEIVCDTRSYEAINSILKLIPLTMIQVYDSTFTPHYKRGSIIPVSDHINRTGQNPLIDNGNSKQIEFIDISNLYHYHSEKNSITTDCCGEALNKAYIYPSHYLCNFAIVARSMGIKKIQAFLYNIYTKYSG